MANVYEELTKQGLYHLVQAVSCLAQAGGCAAGGQRGYCGPEAFDAEEAATHIGVGKSTLYQLKSDEELANVPPKKRFFATVKVGGRPKFLRKDLDRYLESLEKG